MSPAANPASVPINLRIDFVPSRGSIVRLASVSLFPVDQAQTFAVRLPAKPGRLAVALIPGPGPLTIDLGPIIWRQTDP